MSSIMEASPCFFGREPADFLLVEASLGPGLELARLSFFLAGFMEGAGGRDFALRLETSSFDLLPLGSTRCTALLPSAFPSKRSSNERLPMASRKQTAIENNDTVNDFVWLVCSCYCGVSCCTLDCRLAAGSSQLRRCAQLAMSRSLWFLRLSPGDVHQRTPASAARSANEGGREHTCWHLTQSILYISVAQNARVWHLPW